MDLDLDVVDSQLAGDSRVAPTSAYQTMHQRSFAAHASEFLSYRLQISRYLASSVTRTSALEFNHHAESRYPFTRPCAAVGQCRDERPRSRSSPKSRQITTNPPNAHHICMHTSTAICRGSTVHPLAEWFARSPSINSEVRTSKTFHAAAVVCSGSPIARARAPQRSTFGLPSFLPPIANGHPLNEKSARRRSIPRRRSDGLGPCCRCVAGAQPSGASCGAARLPDVPSLSCSVLGSVQDCTRTVASRIGVLSRVGARRWTLDVGCWMLDVHVQIVYPWRSAHLRSAHW
ncbi:hypothetical protein C8Q76DRAFT_188329 [Earliella scabrosa]|nr:hypothetical protein C8Q76DRAFT_188329 [Earliella scabrosa]